MEEYYKFFGLEEAASLEDVTARYLEMKKHLGSVAKSGRKADFTLGEINAAYRGIKSSRAPVDANFDLGEHLKEKYERRTVQIREAKARKIFYASGVLVVCLIAGAAFYIFERPQAPIPWPTAQE